MFLANDRTGIYRPLLNPRYLAAFRKNSIATSHLRNLYRYSRAFASLSFARRVRRVCARGFEVELSVSSVLERDGIGSQGQDRSIDKTTALQLAVHAATPTDIYTRKTHVHYMPYDTSFWCTDASCSPAFSFTNVCSSILRTTS